MDINKFYEFFQPGKHKERIHIIGCGAVGSTIAELLVRMGLTKFTLYDEDIVEAHNIANQMFRDTDILKPKVDALEDIMKEINPDVEIKKCGFYKDQILNGYVFMAVDKVSVRREIVENNMGNASIKAVFDARIRLTDAQAYAARWDNQTEKINLLKSLNFTDEEADAETPVSACNMTLSVAPTVRLICNYVVSNFINMLNDDENNFKRMILIDAFTFNVNVF